MEDLPEYTHPEIEFVSGFFYHRTRPARETAADLLEIYSDSTVVFKENLDHSQLLLHFEDATPESDKSKGLSLRIFFLEALNFTPLAEEYADGSLESDLDDMMNASSTAKWMHQRFGTSPLFFYNVLEEIYEHGKGCFQQHGKDSQTLDGLYCYPTQHAARNHTTLETSIWYSHKLGSKSLVSTYIVHLCPKEAKHHILKVAQRNGKTLIQRPLSVDIFMADICLRTWLNVTSRAEGIFLQLEVKISNLPLTKMIAMVQDLSFCSRQLLGAQQYIAEIASTASHLLLAHQRLVEMDCHSTVAWNTNGIRDSLFFLESRCQHSNQWAANFLQRVSILNNLIFNVSAQSDNRTNLEIAKLTSGIAVSTQKDSSSMITIAAVTMFFLPGTFVSAIFSQVFFNTETGSNALVVGPQWWLFPAITIPLTVVVFGIWVVWQQYRHKQTLKGIQIKEDVTFPVNPMQHNLDA